MRPKLVSAATFVSLWQKADSARQVAKILGRHPGAVRNRASRLRRSGVPLKSMRGPRLDLQALAKRAKEALP